MPTLNPTLHRLITNARQFALVALWASALTVFVHDNLLQGYAVHGSSMSPALSPDFHDTGREDRLLYLKYRPTAGLKRGDVVSFWHPLRPEDRVVKRVIGLEGDLVLLDERRRPGSEEVAARGWDVWGGRVRVPQGHVWVEGDNWRKSADSNYYGPVSKALIAGKAVGVLLPVGRMGTRPWEWFESATRVVTGGEGREVDGEMMELGRLDVPP